MMGWWILMASLKSNEMIRQAAVKCLSLETITKRTKFDKSMCGVATTKAITILVQRAVNESANNKNNN